MTRSATMENSSVTFSLFFADVGTNIAPICAARSSTSRKDAAMACLVELAVVVPVPAAVVVLLTGIVLELAIV